MPTPTRTATRKQQAGCWDGDYSIAGSADVATLTPHACITGSLAVAANDALETVLCLDGGYCLIVESNAALPQCEACALLDQLAGFAGAFPFKNNLPDACPDTCD